MTPSRKLSAEELQAIDEAIGHIVNHCYEHSEPIPYKFNPDDPRHAKMYYRAYDDNAYIPILIFIYKYGSDKLNWGPVMVFFNPKSKDKIWLHGFLRSHHKRSNGGCDEYVESLWRGIHVSDPNFGGILGYDERSNVDFLSLVSHIGDKERLESTIMSLLVGKLAQAEMWLNYDAAKTFREESLLGPKMPFYLITIDLISYPATIFLKKFMMLLIRCARENSGQFITHRFRVPPVSWMK